jgi:hypothetical protein
MAAQAGKVREVAQAGTRSAGTSGTSGGVIGWYGCTGWHGLAVGEAVTV